MGGSLGFSYRMGVFAFVGRWRLYSNSDHGCEYGRRRVRDQADLRAVTNGNVRRRSTLIYAMNDITRRINGEDEFTGDTDNKF